MADSDFFRISPAGEKINVSWEEIHCVRRAILDYFEENLNEPVNVFVYDEYNQIQFWKYLSISYDREWGESARARWLIEQGCLAMLNGQALEFLTDQLVYPSQHWDEGKLLAADSLPALYAYQPSKAILAQGKEMLIDTMKRISELSEQDLDEDGLTSFEVTEQGKWFTKNIIGDYFRSTARMDFG